MTTKPFFGLSGLSSTSANHYCNLAEEISRSNTNFLNNVCFYSTTMSVLGDKDSEHTIRNGMDSTHLDFIPQTITQLTELYSLIAFFREAIKEKERLTELAKAAINEEKHEQLNAEKEAIEARRPIRGAHITDIDVINEWSIGEQEKYLSIEAKAATIGKMIHENGCISNARKALMAAITCPTSFKEQGRDTVIYESVPTVTQEEVDQMYLSLQSEYRAAQAELNGFKKTIEDKVEAHNAQVDEEYRLALVNWNTDMSDINRKIELLAEEDKQLRRDKLAEVQNLKIAVPKRLEPIFKKLQQYKPID